MKDSDIEKSKIKYNELSSKNNHIKDLLKEKEELLNNSYVKRYLELEDVCDSDLISEIHIIDMSFRNISFDLETPVYVYLGMYINSYNYDGHDKPTRNIKEADYVAYRSLDTEELINIPPSLKIKFEEENIIIFGIHDFYKFRMFYLEELLKCETNNKNKALKKVLEYVNKRF